jgi:predicted nucleotidyltransferase
MANTVDAEEWLAQLIDHDMLPAGCRAAFVVGSAARGWTNSRSDFDIYVVSDTERQSETVRKVPVPLNPPYVNTETFYAGGRRWEITFWLEAQFDQMLSKVGWDQYNENYAGDVLTPREEVVLSRISTCVPLHGHEWVTRLRTRLDESAFRSLILAQSLSLADDAIEDALGQMEDGNLESATISAFRAFGLSIDSLLASHGEFGSTLPKWRPMRFRAVEQDVIPFDDYWAFETMQGYDAHNPEVWIRSVLTICQDIAMRVETS